MNPKSSNGKIARALLSELRSGKDIKQVTKSLAAYLTQERRLSDAGAVVRELERLLLNEEGRLYVHSTTAFPLSEQQKTEISQMFAKASRAKDIIIQESIDKDVIGGVRLQTADHQLDLTVQRQLQRLKHANVAHTA